MEAREVREVMEVMEAMEAREVTEKAIDMGITPSQGIAQSQLCGYIDHYGRIVLIKESCGHWSMPRRFGAYCVNDKGFPERIRSVCLPWRASLEEAQKDLADFVFYRSWKPIA